MPLFPPLPCTTEEKISLPPPPKEELLHFLLISAMPHHIPTPSTLKQMSDFASLVPTSSSQLDSMRKLSLNTTCIGYINLLPGKENGISYVSSLELLRI